jgi:hypothetical protein
VSDLPDLHGMIRELTDKHVNRERYDTLRGRMRVYQDHVTTNPALLDQLADAVQPSSSTGAGVARPAASKPAARIDAIDTLVRIDYQAFELVRRLGGEPRKSTKDLVRQVGALSAATDHGMTDSIHRQVTRWWIWARVVTGWDLPAWQPANTCPLCGTRGSLRVRVVEMIATCIEDHCRETWGSDTIGLLADHIRSENGEQEAS